MRLSRRPDSDYGRWHITNRDADLCTGKLAHRDQEAGCDRHSHHGSNTHSSADRNSGANRHSYPDTYANADCDSGVIRPGAGAERGIRTGDEPS